MNDELKKLKEWKQKAKSFLHCYRDDLSDTLLGETIFEEPKFTPEYVPILESRIKELDKLLEE